MLVIDATQGAFGSHHWQRVTAAEGTLLTSLMQTKQLTTVQEEDARLSVLVVSHQLCLQKGSWLL
jgi:hypothetical protein